MSKESKKPPDDEYDSDVGSLSSIFKMTHSMGTLNLINAPARRELEEERDAISIRLFISHRLANLWGGMKQQSDY